MTQEVAVVIGVGSGLGIALVRCLAGAGQQVIAAARDGGRLRALLDEAGPAGPVDAQACDARDPQQVMALFSQVAAAHGPPSLVIYNVGVLARGKILELTPAAFESAWRSITLGGFLVGQAAAGLMRPLGRGTILFTGATSALRGKAGFAAAAAARAGLRALAQSMARELGPEGIHVAHVVVDGGINRPELAERIAGMPPDSLLDPDAIAGSFLALHRQHRSAWTQELDLRPWREQF